GGYAQSVHYQASHRGGGSAVLALRVPVQKAQTAIAKLGALGKLLSQQVSTQDLQAKLTHQTSAIGSLKRAIAVYETALQSTPLPPPPRAALHNRPPKPRSPRARTAPARAQGHARLRRVRQHLAPAHDPERHGRGPAASRQHPD